MPVGGGPQAVVQAHGDGHGLDVGHGAALHEQLRVLGVRLEGVAEVPVLERAAAARVLHEVTNRVVGSHGVEGAAWQDGHVLPGFLAVEVRPADPLRAVGEGGPRHEGRRRPRHEHRAGLAVDGVHDRQRPRRVAHHKGAPLDGPLGLRLLDERLRHAKRHTHHVAQRGLLARLALARPHDVLVVAVQHRVDRNALVHDQRVGVQVPRARARAGVEEQVAQRHELVEAVPAVGHKRRVELAVRVPVPLRVGAPVAVHALGVLGVKARRDAHDREGCIVGAGVVVVAQARCAGAWMPAFGRGKRGWDRAGAVVDGGHDQKHAQAS
mmetsp:Transcript_14620/g.34517  ORF Transcript_14620/g.34517 Transcript_14620/m.34517 type:complete len:324 (+) Transcript_14620:389-1360(+)